MTEPLGAYVHIPFCAERCDYCAFAIWTDRNELIDEYVSAVAREITRARDEGVLTAPRTVFIGGGTPSLIGAARLATLLEALAPLPGTEVSVECNPESTTRPLLEGLAAAGVTRISLGVQSFVPRVLRGLGRSHEPHAVEQAVAWIGEIGFPTFSVDLVFGGASETDDDWRTTIEAVLSLDPAPPHVSAYALTVEPGTTLAKDRARHPNDDVQADRYRLCDVLLSAAGLSWYEVSNWARPGHECQHNAAYWAQGDYLGFGCAAHSHLAGRRFANVRSIDRYLERMRKGESPSASSVLLDPASRALERLELSLRTRYGVPSESLAEEPEIARLVERHEGRAVLTVAGRLLHNEVAIRLKTC